MSKLSELIAAARAKHSIHPPKEGAPDNTINTIPSKEITNTISESPSKYSGVDKYGKEIIFNKEQTEFIDTVLSGKSCILIGAAGCGKTASTNGAISHMLKSKYIPKIADAHKHLPADNPAIVAVSYTRRAVMNLRQAMPSELKDNCITIHKLLEYAPVFYEVYDEEAGEYKNTMKFEPGRNQYHKLPSSIQTVIIDESSMVSVDLFHQIWVALEEPWNTQFIFLGDIQQLPPVFGSAILGFKLLKLPVIELTQVYRQALESPIIRLAHRILSGKSIPVSEFDEWEEKGKLKLHPWKKRINPDSALLTVAAFVKQAYDANHYDPATDMILIPFNKSFGTIELNKHIANHIAKKKDKVVYEVIAGYNKHYFSEGEKILYEKEDATIIGIRRNPVYAGKWPQSSSKNLNYWGHVVETEEESEFELVSTESESSDDIDQMLEGLASDIEDRVREASHILTLKVTDSDLEVEIKTAADINNLTMAYAITCHKSQGSEYKKVYLFLHQSHNTMIQRELLYTSVTRAKEELYVICEPDAFERGITNSRIKGTSLKDKMEYFKGKLELGDDAKLIDMGITK